jgi:hypothetical protein
MPQIGFDYEDFFTYAISNGWAVSASHVAPRLNTATKVARAFQRVKAETNVLTNITRWKARATRRKHDRSGSISA